MQHTHMVWACSQRLMCMANRTLADIDDRGKLNMQEFHVAMGLIYRSTYFRLFLDSSNHRCIRTQRHANPRSAPTGAHPSLRARPRRISRSHEIPPPIREPFPLAVIRRQPRLPLKKPVLQHYRLIHRPRKRRYDLQAQ